MIDYNVIGNEAVEMERKYRRNKHMLLLHGAYYHPSYRYATETTGADDLREFFCKAHEISNRFSAELYGEDKRRLCLQIVTTVKISDSNMANELKYLFSHEYQAALEELLDLFEGQKIERIIGANINAPQKYNLTICAHYEQEFAPA